MAGGQCADSCVVDWCVTPPLSKQLGMPFKYRLKTCSGRSASSTKAFTRQSGQNSQLAYCAAASSYPEDSVFRTMHTNLPWGRGPARDWESSAAPISAPDMQVSEWELFRRSWSRISRQLFLSSDFPRSEVLFRIPAVRVTSLTLFGPIITVISEICPFFGGIGRKVVCNVALASMASVAKSCFSDRQHFQWSGS